MEPLPVSSFRLVQRAVHVRRFAPARTPTLHAPPAAPSGHHASRCDGAPRVG